MHSAFLVFDLGLTNCKTVLFDEAGGMLERATVGYPTLHPQPDWSEQDPQSWWCAVCDGVAQIRERNPQALAGVSAITVTGHMHALVCLGDEGQSLGPALVLGDRRAAVEAEAIDAQLGMQAIYALTGTRMDVSMPAAKLRWLATHAPALHRNARKFLAAKDWLRHQLTGDLLTEPIDACASSLYDIRRARWSFEMVEAAGIRVAQLPDVVDPCAVAGVLVAPAARALGLTQGIPVIVGAGDDIEVLGNGLLSAGMTLEHLGTTGSILTCTDRFTDDPEMAIEVYPHAIPGLWVLGGSVTAAGAALAWARRVLARQTANEQGDAHPNLSNPLLFVPHLAGERAPNWDARARGGWMGLSELHTVAAMEQAVLEGVAFSLKNVLARIEGLVGEQKHITMSARELANARWMQMRADIYNRRLSLLATDEPTALGAMILAAVGVGAQASLHEAARKLVRTEGEIEPRADAVRDYRVLHQMYLAAEASMRALMREWATLR
jgi:xylulokinase